MESGSENILTVPLLITAVLFTYRLTEDKMNLIKVLYGSIKSSEHI